MGRIRECLKCGALFEGRGSYCPAHPLGRLGGWSSSPVYRTRRWRRLSAELIAEHVALHGWRCPGDGPSHPPHPVAPGQLSVDHIHRLSAGGAPFDRANLRVLCRLRNAQRGLARVSA